MGDPGGGAHVGIAMPRVATQVFQGVATTVRSEGAIAAAASDPGLQHVPDKEQGQGAAQYRDA